MQNTKLTFYVMCYIIALRRKDYDKKRKLFKKD